VPGSTGWLNKAGDSSDKNMLLHAASNHCRQIKQHALRLNPCFLLFMEARELIGLEKSEKTFKPWMPKRVLFTPDALEESYGQEILSRVKEHGIPIEILKANRLTNLRGKDERETYRLAKTTLAVVKAPPSQFRLQPIPPSADWQFHLAQGCPAHCQYCYLAGSLSGPPVIRVYANLPAILENLPNYTEAGKLTTFEASCYTDPLSLEHLTGGLEKTISFFAHLPGAQLRFVTKFTAVQPLLPLQHNGHTRARISINAPDVARRLEGGVPNIEARIRALHQLALPQERGGGGYPVGIVLAPIIPLEHWEEQYGTLLKKIGEALHAAPDVTFELITHRFTEGSRSLLQEWYPNTSLDMSEENRSKKFNKFGGTKYVYNRDVMKALKDFFYAKIPEQLPQAKILYWT
jgi:spore photoproduct lyase